MSDILDIINSRKSIRRYKADPVPEELTDNILEAARWAPTGENYQPWRFIVVRDQETRDRIGDLAKLGIGSRKEGVRVDFSRQLPSPFPTTAIPQYSNPSCPPA